MNKILVPMDGSETATRALRFAVDFANRCGATEIELLNVQPMVHSGLVRAQLSAQAIETALRSMGDETLESFRAFLNDARIGYRPHVAIGNFGETICRHALDSGCSEIVMGSRGMGAIGNMLLGSVATQVAHLSQLPVTLVKETDAWSSLFDPVLVPVDGSDNAIRSIAYVAQRARRAGAGRVRLLNVQEPVVELQTHGLAREAIAKQREDYAAQISETARRGLDDAGVPYVFDFQFGDPAETIVREATAHGCSHIVMGTRGLGAAAALVLGSVAYKTIHGAGVPVTLVK